MNKIIAETLLGAVISHGDKPHPASATDAGSGQGTVSGPPHGKTQDRPVLDGSTQSRESEREVDNPWRGVYDPELHRHPEREPHHSLHGET